MAIYLGCRLDTNTRIAGVTNNDEPLGDTPITVTKVERNSNYRELLKLGWCQSQAGSGKAS